MNNFFLFVLCSIAEAKFVQISEEAFCLLHKF